VLHKQKCCGTLINITIIKELNKALKIYYIFFFTLRIFYYQMHQLRLKLKWVVQVFKHLSICLQIVQEKLKLNENLAEEIKLWNESYDREKDLFQKVYTLNLQ